MLALDFKTQAFDAYMDRVADQDLPKVAAMAVTSTAKDARDAERQRIEKVYDSPRSFTLNGVSVQAANKREEKPTAEVFVKDTQADYLRFTVEGGTRSPETDDPEFGKAGFDYPGPDARLNKHGNFARGKIGKLFATARQDEAAVKAGEKPYLDRKTLFFGQVERGGESILGTPCRRCRPSSKKSVDTHRRGCRRPRAGRSCHRARSLDSAGSAGMARNGPDRMPDRRPS